MRNRTDIATLHKIAIEVQRLRTLAINDGSGSVASLLEAALNETRAELAHRGEPPDPYPVQRSQDYAPSGGSVGLVNLRSPP
jgi:hypothetical protein